MSFSKIPFNFMSRTTLRREGSAKDNKIINANQSLESNQIKHLAPQF